MKKKPTKLTKLTKPKKLTVLEKSGRIAKPSAILKLDLACGRHCQDGFEGVDIVQLVGADKRGPDGKIIGKFADVVHVVDLMQPWPWPDNSVAEVHCSHFVEHIPMSPLRDDGQDPFLWWFDQLWRVLDPEGSAKIIVPCARSDRAFQDPTHRRFLVETSFAYISKVTREAMDVDHYNVKCDFEVQVIQTIADPALNAMMPEVAGQRMRTWWNQTMDLHVTLKPNKPK